MSNDYFKAQGWFKTYALNSQDSRGVFQELVKEDEEAFRLASAESDRIKAMMNEKYGPGTVKYGSEIKQPEIKTPQAIFEFSQRNPAAEGGRMGYKNAKLVIKKPLMTEEKQKISSSPLKEDYLGQLKDKRKVRTSSLNDAIEIRNIIVKNNGHISNIEDLGKKTGIFVGGKSGKVDTRKTKLALDLALDSFDELKGFKLAVNKYPNIDKSGRKFRYLDMVAKSFANHNTAKNSLEASAHLLQDNMAMIVDMGGKETFEKGFFNLKGKITNADKKFISERVASLTGKDFNIDSVNELIEETSKVRRSEGSIASKLKRYAKQNEDIKNLYNDSTIQKLIKGDLNNKTRQKILNRAVDIVGDDVAIASRRLFMMAESMAGTRPIEGIVENKNLGNKLIDTQRIIGKKVKDGRAFSSLVYNHYAKTIDNALGTGPGKSFIGYYQQRIKNALNNGLVPDEIFSVTASARRGMSPYAIFTQALDADVNSSIKGANLDGLLSKTHRDLQEVFQGRTYDKLNTADKKTVQELVGTFENAKKDVLKNLKPEVRDTIQLAEFDLKNPPSKSIANYDSYDKNLQKAFNKSFKDTGYSMKVTKDMKTQKELLTQLESYITDTTGKVKQPMLSSGLSGAYEMMSDDLKAIVNSDGFKKFANSKAGKTLSMAAKTPGKLFGVGDVLIGYLDYTNNKPMMSEAKAYQNMLQAMSFGIYRGGDKQNLEEIKTKFIENGGDGKIFDQVVDLNKSNFKMKEYIENIKKSYKDLSSAGYEDMAKKQMKSALNNVKTMGEKNLDKFAQYKTDLAVSESGEPIQIKDITQPIKDTKKAAFDLFEEEQIKNYPSTYDQVNTGSGPVAEQIYNSILTKDSYKKLLPQNIPSTVNQLLGLNFKPVTEKEKEAALIQEMKKNAPQELYRYNKEFRNMDPDNPITMDETAKFMQKNKKAIGFAEGGITELRSKYEYKK